MPTRSAAAWLEAVRDAERRGELLTAFDLAESGLAEHPGDVALQHRAVLALARAGSAEAAARRFEAYGLAASTLEDVRALSARLAKDEALAATGSERRRLAAVSARRYAEIFAATGGYYPAVNAATLHRLGGDAARSRELAEQALAALDGADGYYAAATEAEAQLLLGREDAARAALERAVALHAGDHGALATTRRQLRALDADPGLVAVLGGPAIAHFCGHRIAPGSSFAPADEPRVAAAIAAELDRAPVAFAYGSLAGGADILWAEALLARGAGLHVVLPFAREEFVRVSVAAAGPGWAERFERCLAAAAAVSYATDDAFLGDDVLYRYGSELAMGMALLRGRYLDASPRQLAVWDGEPAAGAAGTAIDVATWTAGGREAVVVRTDGTPMAAPLPRTPAAGDPASGRVVRALLFADVKGFSRLADEQLPRFTEHVLGALAAALAAHEPGVWHRNTWGDGLYAVLTDAVVGAHCALDLQAAMAAVDLRASGLPEHLALRLGAHLGPVFRVHDPIRGAVAFMGSHVSRTARIEPVTPAGSVYVTEPFAAALVLAGGTEFRLDYVGHMPAAKDYGRLRMYRLQRGVSAR